MVPAAVVAGPVVDASVTFELLDPHGRLAVVRLVQEIGLPGRHEFEPLPGAWRLALPLPEVDRMEYLFELADHNGNRLTITDPANPLRAQGAFGDKSVLEFASYRPPVWLAGDIVAGTESSVIEAPAPELGAVVTATLWSSAPLDDTAPAPLLVVHDGPEYATLGAFTRYLAASIAAGALPPLRAALLGPGDRNRWYSADPAYAHALGELLTTVPATVRVGVGVSLGGLAMLHAHRTHPGRFDALMLQSGSFFTPQLDPQEADFSGFAAVTGFVAEVRAATASQPGADVLTCGTIEENLANNVEMAMNLRRLGYRADLVRVRDAHNFTAWRDALHPHLTELITEVIYARAA